MKYNTEGETRLYTRNLEDIKMEINIATLSH